LEAAAPAGAAGPAKNSATPDEILASETEIICCAEGPLSKEIAALRHERGNR
jgi:hypothetical protein